VGEKGGAWSSTEGDWAGFHPKDHASGLTVRLLDFDTQEDDVSGAAQDRTAEFAAQSSFAAADFRTAEPSEQERSNETDYMARRSPCLGPWAPSV
jgi:hypothetical protein